MRTARISQSRSLFQKANVSGIIKDMDTMPQDAERAGMNPEQLPDTWGARITQVATIWGLGVGTAVALCLDAWLVVRLGGGEFALTGVLTLAMGMMLAAGTAYLQYVQRHLRIVFTSDVRHGSLIAAMLGGVMLFICAALVVALTPLLLGGFALYAEAGKRKGLVMTTRQQRDKYIGGLLPRLSAF